MQRHLAFYSPLKKHLTTKIGSFPLIKNGSKNARVLFYHLTVPEKHSLFSFWFLMEPSTFKDKKGDISMQDQLARKNNPKKCEVIGDILHLYFVFYFSKIVVFKQESNKEPSL